MRSIHLSIIVLLTLPAVRASAQTKAPAPLIPESKITALQTELLRSRSKRATSTDRRRACKSVIRKGVALLEAHPAAPNRFPLLGIVLQSQKRLLGLASTERNRKAIYDTCGKLAQAPDEYAELRLEADMILSEKALALRGANVEARLRALKELIAQYRGTTAEAKSLMIAVHIAMDLVNEDLAKTILNTMDDRFQGDPKTIEFRRRALNAATLDAVFSGTYECADGTSLTFPIDRMGHTSLMYFWSKDTPHLAQRMGDVKALQERFPGQCEVYSFNLDELPDAGEKRLRELGLDWTAMHLSGGKKSPAYRAYATKDPNAVLVNEYGHTLLVSAIQYQGIPLIPPREGAPYRQDMAGGSAPRLEQCLYESRYLSQIQSLFIGDFLVTEPFGPFGPSLPPELKMVPRTPKSEAVRLKRTPESIPAEVLDAIQSCFIPSPLRYRLTSLEALANYQKAEKLCGEAVSKYPKTPDLWLVRNRRIIALLGMWNLAREPKHLARAVAEARASLATDLPRGADVVPRFCLAKGALRRGDADREALLTALVKAAGGDNAPASAYAAAAILALDANVRGLYARYSRRLLDAPDEGNPMLWSVTSFFRDRHHAYRRFRATHGRRGFCREARHNKRRNVAALDMPADTSRSINAEFKSLSGEPFGLPQDTAGKLTVICFMELPADEEAAKTQLQLVGGYKVERVIRRVKTIQEVPPILGDNVIAAFLSNDPDEVKALVEKNGWACPVVLVLGGIKNPLVQRLGILSADRIPNLVLLRGDGTISWFMSGLPYQIQGSSIATTVLYAVNANITVCQMEAAAAALQKGKFQEAASVFVPEGYKSARGDWWASFRFYGRARAYVGLKNWEAALADIDVAIESHKVFTGRKVPRCKRVAEMRITRAAILEKLGRMEEAKEERALAAAPTVEHNPVPFGLYGDDSKLKRLSPH